MAYTIYMSPRPQSLTPYSWGVLKIAGLERVNVDEGRNTGIEGVDNGSTTLGVWNQSVGCSLD